MCAAPTSEREVGQVRRLQRAPGFAEEVFDIIRTDIMSLRIPPDTRISIDSLARELGVSQTPIREALSMLEAIGLVTKRHYAGYCSAPQLNRRQLDELYEMRLLMEPFAARCAAERMNDADLARVRALADSMEPGDTRHSYDRFADQDAELHNLIAHGSGNGIVEESLARLHVHLHIFRLRFHSEVTREAFSEHAELVIALAARDPAAAEAAMRAHIEKSYNRLMAFASS
ncbi:GntR family transcriptional regulator [Sphingomonas sp. MMS24-J13]|uniref:GntR family transcriptional regulator n=1 Tax=Sphingomonas sp. MMS24-J13 TaxID=3238686 RepID=UPI00384EB65E